MASSLPLGTVPEDLGNQLSRVQTISLLHATIKPYPTDFAH